MSLLYLKYRKKGVDMSILLPLFHIFIIFALKKIRFMKTNNMYPERFSFSEIKSMLGNIDEQKNALQIIGRDVGMLRTGHKLFSNLLQTGTPYIIEDCRLAFIKREKPA